MKYIFHHPVSSHKDAQWARVNTIWTTTSLPDSELVSENHAPVTCQPGRMTMEHLMYTPTTQPLASVLAGGGCGVEETFQPLHQFNTQPRTDKFQVFVKSCWGSMFSQESEGQIQSGLFGVRFHPVTMHWQHRPVHSARTVCKPALSAESKVKHTGQQCNASDNLKKTFWCQKFSLLPRTPHPYLWLNTILKFNHPPTFTNQSHHAICQLFWGFSCFPPSADFFTRCFDFILDFTKTQTAEILYKQSSKATQFSTG